MDEQTCRHRIADYMDHPDAGEISYKATAPDGTLVPIWPPEGVPVSILRRLLADAERQLQARQQRGETIREHDNRAYVAKRIREAIEAAEPAPPSRRVSRHRQRVGRGSPPR